MPGGATDRLKAIFRGELQDHARSVEEDLLKLEHEAAPEARTALYTSMFRAIHSLKGAARVAQEPTVEAVCHRLEEIFQHLRDGRFAAGPELFQLLLDAIDAIRRMGRGEASGDGSALIPRLEAAIRGEAAPAPTTPEPAAPPAAASADGFVRMSAGKLDDLLSRSEQLLVARRRLDLQAAALTAIRDDLGSQERAWSDVEREVSRALAGRGADGPSAEPGGRDATGRALAAHAARQRRLARNLQVLGDQLASDRRALHQAADALDGEIRRARMFPFASACEGLVRAARDLAAGSGKDARVVVEGGHVELDRTILEGLRDPLLHLVRNAVDHGIEPPQARERAGKPPGATITVAARRRGLQVEIEVSDDGRGIDASAVLDAARARGLEREAPASTLDLIFRSGFSTATTVTEVSGRGFGLDVVKSRVEAMRGAVSVATEPGRGTSFRLTLPLTLTTVRGLLVSAGGQTLALDAGDIERLLRITPDDLGSVEGRLVLKSQGEPIVFANLARLLGLDSDWAPSAGEKTPVVVLAAGGRRAAFAVEALLTEQDLLIRDLGRRLRLVRLATGATTLADGRVALILRSQSLVEAAFAGTRDSASALTAANGPRPQRRLLLADDSITTRTLMKTILESAGYEVTATPDGAAAWRFLQEGAVDLVVSDVEMPQMDGIALTEAIRASPRLHDLPVVLVTALESDLDRARGLEAGANAYLVKSAFDQRELLQVVGRLL